ncbi:MAG: pyruvate kinase [Candidatus Aceula meridiana]|nr:pyruvate kinase [Candidatus Aceula meridiana]
MKRARTKIICTLGPASSRITVLRKMVTSGMDVARLNFSHGTHKSHFEMIHFLRLINKKHRRKVLILQDLEGFRIRIGELGDKPGRKVELKKKQIIYLTNKRKDSGKNIIPFDYKGPLKDIKAGHDIYIDDGNIALRVRSVSEKYLKAVVIIPGTIKEHKGMNLPDTTLRFQGVLQKDRMDLAFGLKHNVDFVAQSFVRNKQDVLSIRDLIDLSGKKCQLIAKIENREGLENLDGILDVVDGIMIARGDLGVSLPIHKIPIIQKLIIRRCKQRKKFVITATQMLESMTDHIRPTRAEVSDVANAIIDGSDYTMLSGETAAGKHPVDVVGMMNAIGRYTEDFLKIKNAKIDELIKTAK